MRHAKSSWDDKSLDDHERPLNKRGRKAAPWVGARLAELGWVPQRVLCSTAQRTRETWERMAEAFDPAPEVSYHKELYLAGPRAVRELVGALPPEVGAVMVIGHNFGWEEVVTWLSGEEEPMKTANAALLSVEAGAWDEALGMAPGWTLHQIVRPPKLK